MGIEHVIPGVELKPNSGEPRFYTERFKQLVEISLGLIKEDGRISGSWLGREDIAKKVREILKGDNLNPIERWIVAGNIISTLKELARSDLDIINPTMIAIKPLLAELDQLGSAGDYETASELLKWPYPPLTIGEDKKRGSRGYYAVPLIMFNGKKGIVLLRDYDWVQAAYVYNEGIMEFPVEMEHVTLVRGISVEDKGVEFSMPVAVLKYSHDNGRTDGMAGEVLNFILD